MPLAFRIVLTLMLLPFLGLAQDSTSTEDIGPSHQYRRYNTEFKSVDSTLTRRQYLNFNEYDRDITFQYDIGNLASKTHLKVWDYAAPVYLKESGEFGNFEHFRGLGNVPILKVMSPLAELHYLNTYRKGSHFGGYFTQNIKPDWNYYFGYTRTHSQGNYFRQETNYDNFDFSSNFKNENHRYKGQVIFIWQQTKNEENGGIGDLEEFESNAEGRRELMAVNLYNSSVKDRKMQLFVDHQFMLFSTDTTNETGLAIYHKINLTDKYHTFLSTDTFFENYYLSDETHDSTRFANIYNEAGLKWDFNSKIIESMQGGVFYNAHRYGGTYLLRSGNELGLSANLNGNSSARINWNINGFYSLGELNSGALELNLKVGVGDMSYFGFYGKANSQRPSYFEESVFTNNFIWLNQFENKRIFEGNLFYGIGDVFKIDAGFTQLDKWIIMNQQSLPVQLNDAVQMFNAKLYAGLFHQKAVKLDLNIGFNSMLSGDDFIRLPEFIGDSKLYYDYNAFKKALRGQLGLHARYFTSYQANAYNPALGIHYLQDNQNVGDFIYLNAYAMFQIKTLRIFVALENVLEGLTPYNYYSLPNYAMNDRTFRLGFKWRFFN